MPPPPGRTAAAAARRPAPGATSVTTDPSGRARLSAWCPAGTPSTAGFELIYIVADERDLVRLRTNYRGEKVYLYRLRTDPKIIREVFLDYFKQINRLVDKPRWYNALTQNCTTTIKGHTRPYTQKRPFDWRLLANGYLDQMLYDRKVVDTSYPFEELKKRVYINDKEVLLDNDPNFSYCIRVGVPGIEDIKD